MKVTWVDAIHSTIIIRRVYDGFTITLEFRRGASEELWSVRLIGRGKSIAIALEDLFKQAEFELPAVIEISREAEKQHLLRILEYS